MWLSQTSIIMLHQPIRFEHFHSPDKPSSYLPAASARISASQPARSNLSSRSEDTSPRQFSWYRRAPARDTGQQLPNPVAKRTAAVIVVNIACVTRALMPDNRVADRPCLCNIRHPGVFGSGPAKSSRPQKFAGRSRAGAGGRGLTPMYDGVARSQTIV